MKWLMDDSIRSGVGLSLAEMTVEVGAISELHRHDNCAEAIYLLEGQIRQRIGEKWIDMKSGDTCVIPIGAAHQSHNNGQSTATMILFYSAGERNYEKLGV